MTTHRPEKFSVPLTGSRSGVPPMLVGPSPSPYSSRSCLQKTSVPHRGMGVSLPVPPCDVLETEGVAATVPGAAASSSSTSSSSRQGPVPSVSLRCRYIWLALASLRLGCHLTMDLSCFSGISRPPGSQFGADKLSESCASETLPLLPKVHQISTHSLLRTIFQG